MNTEHTIDVTRDKLVVKVYTTKRGVTCSPAPPPDGVADWYTDIYNTRHNQSSQAGTNHNNS